MNNERGFTLTELLALLGLLGGFALVILAIYAVIHFVLKFW